MSRGIPKAEAESMLVRGFLEEVLDPIENEELACSALEGVVEKWLVCVTFNSAKTDPARDFPILEEKIHGKRLVYLDSGASAQKPNAVLDKMDWAHRHAYANVHRGLHTLANRATEAYEDGRKTVRAFPRTPAGPKKSSSRVRRPKAINLVASSFAGPRDQARATRSSSRSWSTIPTSCRGTSTASARARC